MVKKIQDLVAGSLDSGSFHLIKNFVRYKLKSQVLKYCFSSLIAWFGVNKS